jgi:threonine dehydrogenase-like Zn-dependent dehydrogenase
MELDLPSNQRGVQLTGRDHLALNAAKAVDAPGSHQIVCRVEAAGLCFSDLKLIRAFSDHNRKSEVVSGIAPEVLRDVPSYVPGHLPTVPGHEAAVRVCAVGEAVTCVTPGSRYLVQTDYRWLRTAESNAAFGYNFEGALQQYVLMDERIILSPEGDCMLLPAPDEISASSVALVEPWACVEQAYAVEERRAVAREGRMLVVADSAEAAPALAALLSQGERPGEVWWLSADDPPGVRGVVFRRPEGIERVPDASCDDVVYFGARAEAVEAAVPKIAPAGLLNVVRCGARFRRDVALPLGRAHYSGVRIAGTPGADPAESFGVIPESGEVLAGDTIDIIGAGGPMGVMHVVRTLSLGVRNVDLWAGDLSDARLRDLREVVRALTPPEQVGFHTYNPSRDEGTRDPDYVVVMVPSADLVARTVKHAGQRARINVFAGMPPEEMAPVDLNAYIDKGLYLLGTSGSRVEDMEAVLDRVCTGKLDTDLSVAAVCGLDGVADGVRVMADRSVAGKIVVYPSCEGLGLTRLADLPQVCPAAAKQLKAGVWNRDAESALVRWCSE